MTVNFFRIFFVAASGCGFLQFGSERSVLRSNERTSGLHPGLEPCSQIWCGLNHVARHWLPTDTILHSHL
uniref:Secreted protein n=1 Tax=Anguilla anguilla TaxID=7936 RepID=A0A0E9SY56_ANGAN